MGEQKSERELFSYAINLEKRVRSDHPLRRVARLIDFKFVRAEVAHCYGNNGQVSVDPEVIMKMMFLLFFDDVPSERELMKVIAERLDYLWFLGYGLEDEIPDHSVLSKARTRWGKEVFERLFVRTIEQCVQVGLVDGRKLHVDSSLIEADAARESVIKGPPELIAALKRAYQATESKLGEGVTTPASYEAVNERMMSKTDPDAAMVRRGAGDSSRPRYHHHRAIDDQRGVITAVETTPGSVTENRKLLALIDQHESNTGRVAETVVGDHKYGTQDNFVACQERGLTTHLWAMRAKGRIIIRPTESSRRTVLFTMRGATLIAVPRAKGCGRGGSIRCATRWSIRRPPESVPSVRCAPNAPEPNSVGPCTDMKNKRSWMSRESRRTATRHGAIANAASN